MTQSGPVEPTAPVTPDPVIGSGSAATAVALGMGAGNVPLKSVGKVRKGAKKADAPDDSVEPVGFQVHLVNFTGPLDLLLQLIGKQKLELTELSLSQVTDEFIAYIRALGENWKLDEVSEFLVVASTLLDMKTAKLLPQAEVEDEEDLALLEARDLLFARLLQYKAFKEAAGIIAARDAQFSRGYPRAVKLEQRYTEALPDLVLGIGPDRLAQLAVRALLPKEAPVVRIDHIHMVRVSVREHLKILREKLIRMRTATFRALCADCTSTLEVVARFLGLLELYREGLVSFDQLTALGELTVHWIGDDTAEVEISVDEYGDEEPAAASAEQSTEDEKDDEGEKVRRPRRTSRARKFSRPGKANGEEANGEEADGEAISGGAVSGQEASGGEEALGGAATSGKGRNKGD